MCQAIRCLVVVVHGHRGVRGGRAGLLCLGEWVVVVVEVVVVVLVQGGVVLVLLWVGPGSLGDLAGQRSDATSQLPPVAVGHCQPLHNHYHLLPAYHRALHTVVTQFPPLCVQWAAT